MKKNSLLLIAFLCFSACQGTAQQKPAELNSKEKKALIQYLKETEAGVLASARGLTKAELTFKPAEDKWSVEECIKHIAAAEKELWEMAEQALKQPVNPDKRTEIKFTDEALIKAVEDRSHKSKTFAALEPKNSHYESAEEALSGFKKNREQLIAFVKSDPKELRNHILVLPLGTYDAYQFILLIAAHSKRHTAQIQEVKSNANFPKP